MAVMIGHAHSDENNKAKGGKAGDQTGGEVLIQDWYLRAKGWSVVFRAKDDKVAEKIAKTMELACRNNNIGYDQSQRTTLYTKAKEVNWDISKIKEKCECDCSSLVAICVSAAGILVSKDMYTGNQKELLTNTKKFNVLTATRYLTKPDLLRRGDILLGPGHTAIVLSDGIIKPTIDSAKSFLNSFVGTYTVKATKLNVRCGAGITKAILVTIPKGTKVKCFGYYTKVLGTNWLYVQFIYNNTSYTGFVSSKYLTK
jgi:hypothetical protein